MRAAKAAQGRKIGRQKILRVRLVSLGEAGVGKSCVIKRFCEDKFVSKYIPTIGVDYGVKPLAVGDFELRLNLWDLAGPPDYADVRCEFYRDMQAALLVYDVTSRASFEALPAWLEEARRGGAGSMVVAVVGTKADLPGRRVGEQEARQWAAAHGFLFFEVSASTGLAVQALFSSLLARLLAALPGVPAEMVASAALVAHEARAALPEAAVAFVG